MFLGLIGWWALVCAGFILCAIIAFAWIYFGAENRDGKGEI